MINKTVIKIRQDKSNARSSNKKYYFVQVVKPVRLGYLPTEAKKKLLSGEKAFALDMENLGYGPYPVLEAYIISDLLRYEGREVAFGTLFFDGYPVLNLHHLLDIINNNHRPTIFMEEVKLDHLLGKRDFNPGESTALRRIKALRNKDAEDKKRYVDYRNIVKGKCLVCEEDFVPSYHDQFVCSRCQEEHRKDTRPEPELPARIPQVRSLGRVYTSPGSRKFSTSGNRRPKKSAALEKIRALRKEVK